MDEVKVKLREFLKDYKTYGNVRVTKVWIPPNNMVTL